RLKTWSAASAARGTSTAVPSDSNVSERIVRPVGPISGISGPMSASARAVTPPPHAFSRGKLPSTRATLAPARASAPAATAPAGPAPATMASRLGTRLGYRDQKCSQDVLSDRENCVVISKEDGPQVLAPLLQQLRIRSGSSTMALVGMPAHEFKGASP